MTKNVGGIDRTIRIAIRLALTAAAATGTIDVWGHVGVVPLLTGLIGWCPPYALLGFNSCAVKKVICAASHPPAVAQGGAVR